MSEYNNVMEEPEKYEMSRMRANVDQPKQIGEIILCGSLHIAIFDNQDFVRPTEEQIKNLHDMLCIDVNLFDEPKKAL